ncbi:MAG TPA: hypothetical protein DHV14_01870 [Micrococcales bacterium]|uniref:DUF1048 domain-containing protein n=1 Tax=Miniimonas arenae TaxID=676201 RepID=UPI000EC586EC|nr:DUF1048 domain-containing protein [Miniimonas arenae]HCX83887.1 hypothetical protein [Micrococcales bacterium]
MTGWIEKVTGPLEEKKRYRQHRARLRALPEPYRTAQEGVERYLMHAGGMVGGDSLVRMLDDLDEIFAGAVADRTPVRALVGEDPVAFVEDFLSGYAEGQWVAKERRRLVETIDRAAQADPSAPDGEAPDGEAPDGERPTSGGGAS